MWHWINNDLMQPHWAVCPQRESICVWNHGYIKPQGGSFWPLTTDSCNDSRCPLSLKLKASESLRKLTLSTSGSTRRCFTPLICSIPYLPRTHVSKVLHYKPLNTVLPYKCADFLLVSKETAKYRINIFSNFTAICSFCPCIYCRLNTGMKPSAIWASNILSC